MAKKPKILIHFTAKLTKHERAGWMGGGDWRNGGVGGESVFTWQLTAAAIFLPPSGWLEGGAGAATQRTP